MALTEGRLAAIDLAAEVDWEALDEARAQIAAHNVRTILASVCDGSGASRVKSISADRIDAVSRDGLPFQAVLPLDQSANYIMGSGYGLDTLAESFLFVPDWRSFFITPWHPGTAVVVGDLYFRDGRPAAGAPRLTLRRMLDQLSARGLRITWGWELEFYVFRRDSGAIVPITPDHQAMHQLRLREVFPLLDGVERHLEAAGMRVTDTIHEYGPGQMELNFSPGEGLDGVDRAFLFRLAIKEMFRQQGLVATFMAKPLAGESASGCHIHQALTDELGHNVFADESARDGVSDLLRRWVGGQLEHAAAITGLSAQTVNGYKRFAPYSLAPFNASWGFENRTVAMRVPLDRGAATRVESRIPEACTNPYVAAAAHLAGGLLGLDGEPDQMHFAAGDAYATDLPPLPQTLAQGLAAVRADSALREHLGEEFIQLYLVLRESELRRFQAHVTDWEIGEYLDLM